MSIIPSQKLGMEESSSAPASVTLSRREYCLTAERIPMGIARMTIRTMAPSATMMVVGIRDMISVNTGSLVR